MPIIRKLSTHKLQKQPTKADIATPSIAYLQQQILQNEIQVQSTVTSDFTELETGNKFYPIDASANNVTITLKNAKDRIVVIKKVDDTVNYVRVQSESGLIDGQEFVQIENQNDSYTLICDGSNWWII